MVERERLEQTIAALEAQRDLLGDPVVEVALAPLRERLAAIGPEPGRRPATWRQPWPREKRWIWNRR